MKPSPRNLLFGAFVVCCLAALIWPGYAWLGATVQPRLLGLPWSLTWHVGWIVAAFVACLLYELTTPRPPRSS